MRHLISSVFIHIFNFIHKLTGRSSQAPRVASTSLAPCIAGATLEAAHPTGTTLVTSSLPAILSDNRAPALPLWIRFGVRSCLLLRPYVYPDTFKIY